MNNRERAASVADLVRQFASKHVAPGEKPEVVAGDLICNILHWVMHEGDMAGDDGRKPALAAARCGLSQFISEVHASPENELGPSCYTLITVRTAGGLWVSETGYEEMVQ